MRCERSAHAPRPVSTVSQADLDAVAEQLGRAPRGVLAIAARVGAGEPAVVATAPRLPDGTPFPTFYYLTHPVLVAAMSRLEAVGRMREYEAMLDDPDIAAAYGSAHRQYLAARAEAGDVPEIAGTSAGGMPSRVKCLHALAGHALAAGPGVNPIGDLALADAAVADPVVAALLHPGFADPSV